LLRPGLLRGVTLAVARVGGGDESAIARAISTGGEELGARVAELSLLDHDGVAHDEATVDAAVERMLGEVGSVELLAVDASCVLPAGDARAALVGGLEASWNVTRALANRSLIPSGRGGRIVYVAPRPNAGEHAEAARAGLENLARTLSIEWARHAITPVAIAPGEDTTADEVAALVAYLASPAGAYFSGCELDLRGP
jgi:NAD(P)-dependent dehydrogenase (short-subunit alcohol dehydrogenase family)